MMFVNKFIELLISIWCTCFAVIYATECCSLKFLDY